MTIGELERRAGIEQTPEGRAAFWKPFAHPEASAMLDAGRAELLRRIEQREAARCTGKQELTAQELDAICAFAAEHGRYWKSALQRQWMDASAAPILHRLRNSLGPSWLVKFRIPSES